MRYFGSKASSVDTIIRLAKARVPAGRVCDPFGGIATVGAAFKRAGYAVTTGDQLRFATLFQISKIECCRTPRLLTLRRSLNKKSVADVMHSLAELRGKEGWFVDEFALKRQFFTPENAGKINAIRAAIQRWNQKGLLTRVEFAFLTASLIESMDRVANTAGTYYAYLKHWDRKALKPFSFEPIALVPGLPGKSYLKEASDLVCTQATDILYLDPPYNERRYATYYHLPEFIASDHLHRPTTGLSGVGGSTARSAFNHRSSAADALREICTKAQFRLLIFHYSDQGIISPSEAKQILGAFGKVTTHRVNSSGYTTKTLPRTVEHRIYCVESNR